MSDNSKDLQGAIDAARRRVAELEKVAAEYERTAAAAAGELERVVDEGQAVKLLASATVARNRGAAARAELVTARAAVTAAVTAKAEAEAAAARAAEVAAKQALDAATLSMWDAFEAWYRAYLPTQPAGATAAQTAAQWSRRRDELLEFCGAVGVLKVARTTAGTMFERVKP